MADSEIQILIKAQDEATQILKNIERQVTDTAKNSEIANKKLSTSFSDVQGAMLNLGQVAQGIHNVFETYENSTRKLENAQDRLENATFRLNAAQRSLRDSSLDGEKAQIALERAQQNATDTINRYGRDSLEAREAVLGVKQAEQDLANVSTDLKEKQDAITAAQNKVDVAQRQLNKTISDAKWAYVDMGVQVVSVAGNLGTLLSKMGGFTAASGGMTTALGEVTAFLGAAGPWGLAIGAAAVGLGLLLNKIGNTKTYAQQFIEDQKPMLDMIDKLKESANLADQELGKLLEQEIKLKEINIKTYGSVNGRGTMTSDEMMMQNDPNWAKTKAELEKQSKGILAPSIITGTSSLSTSIKLFDQANQTTFPQLIKNQTDAQKAIDRTGELIGSDKKGSFPLVYSMGLAEVAMTKMKSTSVNEVTQIITKLNEIPHDIYTYHHIVTVYETKGKK